MVKMMATALQIMPIMNILLSYIVGEGGRGGSLGLKHKNIHHVRDFISTPLLMYIVPSNRVWGRYAK